METDRHSSPDVRTDADDNIDRIVDAIENLDAITRELCVGTEDNSRATGDILASVNGLSKRMDGI